MSQHGQTDEAISISEETEQEPWGMCEEEMEDLFRLETRRWLLENGERLFLEKMKMSWHEPKKMSVEIKHNKK